MSTASVLTQPALVLNSSWLAIHTTTAFDALRLMCNGTAKAVVPESYELHGFESWVGLAVPPDEPAIRTVKLRIRVPEIVVLTQFGGQPNPAASFSRRNLFRRDDNRCQYCGRRPGTKELSIDHVFPRARGGRSSWKTACSPARTAITASAIERPTRRACDCGNCRPSRAGRRSSKYRWVACARAGRAS